MLRTFFDFQNLAASEFMSPWEHARLATDEWYFAISKASAKLLIPSADSAAAARGTDDLAFFVKSSGEISLCPSESLSSLSRRIASLAFCTGQENKKGGGKEEDGVRNYIATSTRTRRGYAYIFSSSEVAGANAQRKVLCPEHILVHSPWNQFIAESAQLRVDLQSGLFYYHLQQQKQY